MLRCSITNPTSLRAGPVSLTWRSASRPTKSPLSSLVGQEIGVVTSGSQSPVLGQGIGLGYVLNDPAYTEPGAALAAEPVAARVEG